MASKTAILSVRVISDTKNAQAGLAKTRSAFDTFERGLNKASKYAAVASGALVVLGKKAYTAASDLQQSTGGVESVFKDQAAGMQKWAKGAWKAVGLSTNEAQEAATILGSQLKNLGMPMKDVSKTTQDLVARGADLAATFGGTTSEAVAALSSLLRGERDPIERYGVTINQAMVNAKKAELGLTGLTGAADRQADAQATLALLTEQTADAQGQFAREADTAAGQAQRAAASWENSLAAAGEILLPIVADLAEKLSLAADWAKENSTTVQRMAGVIGGAAAVILGLNGAIKGIRLGVTVFSGLGKGVTAVARQVGMFSSGLRSAQAASSSFSGVAGTLGGAVRKTAIAIGTATKAAAKWALQSTISAGKLVAEKVATLAVAAAKKVAAAAQRIWNLAMKANPIGLIISLVVAAAALIIANWEKIAPVLEAVWEPVKTAALWLWDNVLKPVAEWIGTHFVQKWEALKLGAQLAWDLIKLGAQTLWDNVLKPVAEWIGTHFVQKWEALKLGAQIVWNLIKLGAQTVWNLIKQVGAWIAGTFLKNWNALKLGAQIAWNLIRTGAQNVWNVLKSVGSFVRGTLSSAWNAMRSAGSRAWNGIRSVTSSVWSILRSVGSFVRGTLSSAWNAMRSAGVWAFNAIMSPIRTLYSWLQDISSYVSGLFDRIGNLAGKVFGFSAAPTIEGLNATAAPVTPLLSSSGYSRSSGLNQTVNLTVNLPNYLGDRDDVIKWISTALQQLKERRNGVIAA